LIVGVLSALYCLLVAGVGLELDRRDLALVHTFDKMVGDWRIVFGSPRAPDQRSDIAIVLVTEDSLDAYDSLMPIDRSLLAELVRAIDRAGPKAIGLDIILDRRTRADSELIAALKGAKTPVVLANVDERLTDPDGQPRCHNLKTQEDILKATGRPSGHIMLARKTGSLLQGGDNTIRYIALPAAAAVGTPVCREATAGLSAEAFADVLARTAGVSPRPGRERIAWLRRPANGYDLFDTLHVPRHEAGDARAALTRLVDRQWREHLKDRVVLIGGQLLGRDRHDTPLSVQEGPVSGVTVHAQALAQRLDGNRDLIVLAWWLKLPVVAAVTLACFWMARRHRIDPQGLVWGIAGLTTIGLLALAALRFGRIEIPSIALATAWAGGGFGGFTSKWVEQRLGALINRGG
jgi:CHASE2 domain-containing sensor protein